MFSARPIEMLHSLNDAVVTQWIRLIHTASDSMSNIRRVRAELIELRATVNEFKPFVAPNISTNKSTIYMRRFKIDGTPLSPETAVASQQLATGGNFFSYLVRVLPNPATHGFSLAYLEHSKVAEGLTGETAGNNDIHFFTYSADDLQTSVRQTLSTGGDSSSLRSRLGFRPGADYPCNASKRLRAMNRWSAPP